jgi:hypothetical protein
MRARIPESKAVPGPALHISKLRLKLVPFGLDTP